MAMAVQKMHEIGTSNSQLQNQVTILQSQLEQARVSSLQDGQQNESRERVRQTLESEILRLKSSLDGATDENKVQKTNITQLEQPVAESNAELADLWGLRKLLESQK
jgi:chromosome segregation ATPase